jgi:hypothetical protein
MSASVGYHGRVHPVRTAPNDVGLRWRGAGVATVAVGWLAAAAGLGLSVAAAVIIGQTGSADRLGGLIALTAGIGLTGVGIGMTGVALVLRAIITTIWLRVDSLRAALPALRRAPEDNAGVATSHAPEHRRYSVSTEPPKPLGVHRMGEVMWAPMLLMGLMALMAGLIVSVVQASIVGDDPARSLSLGTWASGVLFLGEGFLLGGISFLLGTILSAIRRGGGEVQRSLGTSVKTLRMPATAKAFLGLMVSGLMVEMAQFGFSAYLASLGHDAVTAGADAGTLATYAAWLGTFRFVGLGLMLSGVVLALATIAKALEFQFERVREIVSAGR